MIIAGSRPSCINCARLNPQPNWRSYRKACEITERGFRRVLKFTHPGVRECEIEAEYAYEFIRAGGRFAYTPIIAGGANACSLHYIANSKACRKGDLLLLDVGAAYANYNADLTRTIPISGRFTPRQKQVYRAVLRVLRECVKGLVPGKKPKDWQKEAEQIMEMSLVDLGLLSIAPDKRARPRKAGLQAILYARRRPSFGIGRSRCRPYNATHPSRLGHDG
jgi:Xaa-Pro aminopeptidase